METQTITIACQGYTTLGLDELVDLQGNLKNLEEKDYVKLRNSITEFGFSFPVFYWEENNVKYILDAHQRIRTLKKMRDEGWVIPPLPADKIEAVSKTEAKKKLLILQSRYGKITETGLTDFVNEPGFEVAIDDISDLLTYPEFAFDTNDPTKANDTNGDADPSKVRELECPNCHTKIKLFGNDEVAII